MSLALMWVIWRERNKRVFVGVGGCDGEMDFVKLKSTLLSLFSFDACMNLLVVSKIGCLL